MHGAARLLTASSQASLSGLHAARYEVLEQQSYLPKVGRSTRAPVSKQQYGQHMHCDLTTLPAAGEANFHRLLETPKSCKIEGSRRELLMQE